MSPAVQRTETAFVFGSPVKVGGLGTQVWNGVEGLAWGGRSVEAIGPGGVPAFERAGHFAHLRWFEVEEPWRLPTRFTPWRWLTGNFKLRQDVRIGSVAASRVSQNRPSDCYAFTQVALETLRWASLAGVPSVLESPNGHIRNFREVYLQESIRWGGAGKRYLGHPSPAMVERVEEEYALAQRIRVSSEWSKASLIAGGVPAEKIHVLQQPVDLAHFRPPVHRRASDGPLRVCFVGSLDLRKGFAYLLRALRQLKTRQVSLEMVGATGDRLCRKVFEREARGLQVHVGPADPLPAYHRAELFVLPTLEDGSPFAVAEAMASGLAVVVTDACGSAEWVEPGKSGWVVPAANSDALAEALERALKNRASLEEMGANARRATQQRADPVQCAETLSRWFGSRDPA